MSLLKNLKHASHYDHPVTGFEVIETHISWVLLTGEYAYKIKKPVNFGFLDFSTLEKRRYYCEEELRLNRRLAPQIYQSVVCLTGTEDHPAINGSGPVIEYAVKMKQFPQSAQLDRMLHESGLDYSLMDKLAARVAEFHLTTPQVDAQSQYGDLEHIRAPVLENFTHIRAQISSSEINSTLDKLEEWSLRKLDRLGGHINERKQQGFVRECHGDMHLKNIALWNNEIILFDCIEFNQNFYLIDVISDLAFLIMDLEDREQTSLAWYFLNRYLAITGDYAGLSLLRFYKVYRAMVRAKVDALRVSQEQSGTAQYKETLNDFRQYLQLAEQYIEPATPALLINHGLSGSGKTWTTDQLLRHYPAIRVRSDVERKRLFNMNNDDSPGHTQNIYTPEATDKTYARLLKIAHDLLLAGYSVIIDAANLNSKKRMLFYEIAESLNVPFVILNYQASYETLRQRVQLRSEHGEDDSDATVDVLSQQFEKYKPPGKNENRYTLTINTDQAVNPLDIIKRIASLLEEQRTSPAYTDRTSTAQVDLTL